MLLRKYSLIFPPILEFSQSITDLTAETLNKTSILISWGLVYSEGIYSNLIFSVYFAFRKYENLAGTTTDMHYKITELPININYSIRVESQIPFSTLTISATIYHYLKTLDINNTTLPTNEVLENIDDTTQPSTYILVAVVVILIISIVSSIITVAVLYYLQQNTDCLKKNKCLECKNNLSSCFGCTWKR